MQLAASKAIGITILSYRDGGIAEGLQFVGQTMPVEKYVRSMPTAASLLLPTQNNNYLAYIITSEVLMNM